MEEILAQNRFDLANLYAVRGMLVSGRMTSGSRVIGSAEIKAIRISVLNHDAP